MSETYSELRHVISNRPPPRPSLDVVFAIGDQGEVARAVCERFANDFGFCLLFVPDHLRNLLDSCTKGEWNPQALGCMHPLALHNALESRMQVSAVFLVPILHHAIDQAVRNGYTRFLIAGFGGDRKALRRFSKEIAVPSAILAFQHPEKGAAAESAENEKQYSRLSVTVQDGQNEVEVYKQILAQVFQKAL